MKNFVALFLSIALVFVPAGRAASSSEAGTVLSKLEAALREEIAHDNSPNQSNRRGDEGQRAMLLLQLRSAFARPESAEFDALLNQIPPLFHSQNVQKNVDALRAAVVAEREARDKALAERVEALLTGAARAVESAQQARDLDAAIRDLNPATEFRENVNEKIRPLLDRLRNARQFVIFWQDYLDHRGAGRADLAEQSLQQANSVATANLVPRSAILERLAEFRKKKDEVDESPLPRLRAIMERAKTIADLPAAVEAIEKLRQRSKRPDDWANPIVVLHRELIKLQQCYNDFKRGLPTVFSLAPAEVESSVHPEVIQLASALKLELARLVFPRFLRIDQAPRKDEPMDDYVDRIMRLAFERCDARLIMRVYQLRNAINRTNQGIEFSRGLDALLAAQNQEQAGQFLLAVLSYQKALRAGGELVPAQAIGARLEAIKAAHPAEYDAAIKRHLSEPDIGPPLVTGPQNYSLQVPGADPAEHSPSPSP